MDKAIIHKIISAYNAAPVEERIRFGAWVRAKGDNPHGDVGGDSADGGDSGGGGDAVHSSEMGVTAMPTYYQPMMSADARETIINAVLDDPRTDSLFKGNALGGFVRDVVEIAAIRARRNGVQLDHAAILWHMEQGVQSLRHEKDYAALIYAAKTEEEKASCE